MPNTIILSAQSARKSDILLRQRATEKLEINVFLLMSGMLEFFFSIFRGWNAFVCDIEDVFDSMVKYGIVINCLYREDVHRCGKYLFDFIVALRERINF